MAVAIVVALVIAAIWAFSRPEPVEVPVEPGEAVLEPQQPDAPAAEIVYGDELRANWDVTGVAAGDRLNVRAGPGVHNAVTATLSRDTVELESTGRIARVDGVLWREIVVPGDATGWVNARYLTETLPTPVYGDELRANWDVTGVAAGDRLNVRAGPGVHNAVTATLSRDTVELESTGRIARVDGVLWREIVVPGDATGWVNARYLTETTPPEVR